MPDLVRSLLGSRVAALLARVLLTFPYWGSGLDKLFGFGKVQATMAQFGLQPAFAFAAATVAVQLVGSALVIANRWAWLGAGALGIFTALTIPIAHRFWALEGEAAVHAFHTAAEHVGMIGGLILAAMLASRDTGDRSVPLR